MRNRRSTPAVAAAAALPTPRRPASVATLTCRLRDRGAEGRAKRDQELAVGRPIERSSCSMSTLMPSTPRSFASARARRPSDARRRTAAGSGPGRRPGGLDARPGSRPRVAPGPGAATARPKKRRVLVAPEAREHELDRASRGCALAMSRLPDRARDPPVAVSRCRWRRCAADVTENSEHRRAATSCEVGRHRLGHLPVGDVAVQLRAAERRAAVGRGGAGVDSAPVWDAPDPPAPLASAPCVALGPPPSPARRPAASRRRRRGPRAAPAR